MKSPNEVMDAGSTKLSRSLTLFPLVILGLAYMIPTAAFGPYGVVAVITEGRVPAAYLLALVMISFTAYSYGKLVKEYPSSGSAYTYTQNSIGPHIGFIVGWAVMTDYLLLPLLNVYVSSVFMHSAMPNVPFAVWVFLFIVPVTIISIKGVKISANINTLLIVFQVLFIIIFLVISIYQIVTGKMGSGFSFKPIYNADMSFLPVITGASIVATSFLGFDAVTTFAEETKNPEKTVPKAILFVAAIGGLLFIIITYALTSVFPDYTAYQEVDAAAMEITIAIGSNLLTALAIAAIITGNTGGILAAQSSGARLLYAMGRDSVLPKKIFGRLHAKYKTPTLNIMIIALICFGAFLIDSELGFSLVNFGALFAFTFVNLSIISHFYIKKRLRGFSNTIKHLVLPLIGASLTAWIWFNLSKNALIFGGIWVTIGMIYLAILTKGFTKKPPQYRFDE